MGSEVLQIGISEIGGTHVVKLTGELDSYTSPRFGEASKKLLDSAQKVLVNLDGLEFIDSSGLAALVGLWVSAKERGISFLLSCQNPRIYRVLEITGLLNLFTIVGAVSDSFYSGTESTQDLAHTTPFAAEKVQRAEQVLSPPIVDHKS